MFGICLTTICSIRVNYLNGGTMIESFIVFTAEHCPGCGPVKDFLRKTSISGKIMDIAHAEGAEQAIRFAVRSLPTVVFLDRGKNEVARAHNVTDVKTIIRGD